MEPKETWVPLTSKRPEAHAEKRFYGPKGVFNGFIGTDGKAYRVVSSGVPIEEPEAHCWSEPIAKI